MVTSTFLKQATSLTIGKGTIRFEQDDTATSDFINGLQAGMLAYEVHGKKARLYDTDVILMIVARQNARLDSPPFHAGFVVGNISSLVQKGVYQTTNRSFCEGYREGIEAYCMLGRRHMFTLSELCSLVFWKHRDKDSAFNAGYIAGFIQGLTEGVHAILKLVRGAREGKQ
jgi:hypothetical protein